MSNASARARRRAQKTATPAPKKAAPAPKKQEPKQSLADRIARKKSRQK